ncbi:hypothetical protein [Candidatus Pelagibacter communis]|uniref:hypothetical protein n=1 Tax=Pelagibacter ubique TaxID=198252 RepID=UPI00094CB434|nr:hypothetical protein [Candidatus Pelagibacter ubique]
MKFNKNLDIDEVVKSIKKNTFFSEQRVLSKEDLRDIHKELDLWNLNLNKNQINPTKTFNGWYHSMAMARSKKVYEILASDFILNTCEKYFKKSFRLKAHRVYSVTSGARMPWHSDDKSSDKKHDYEGLIFIFYLKDVSKGQFQIIKDSENFSKKFPDAKIEERIIDKNYKDQIIDFIMPEGSMVIYNDKAIHRAKPYFDPFWYRTSLFIQVDTNIDNGEKTIINPSFVKNIDQKKLDYFGFGKNSDLPHEPVISGYHTLDYKDLFKIIFNSVLSILILKPYYLLRRSFILKNIIKKLFR